MAAQVLGYDKPDPYQIYNLSDDQLEAVKKKLIELKPNIRKYWSTGGELTNLFQNHEIIAAMGWPLMTNQLRKLGFPIGETIPKENTTGWIDHLMITAAAAERTGGAVPGIHDRSENAEIGDRRDRLLPRESLIRQFYEPERNEKSAHGRSGRLHAANLFLAGRAAPRQIQ